MGSKLRDSRQSRRSILFGYKERACQFVISCLRVFGNNHDAEVKLSPCDTVSLKLMVETNINSCSVDFERNNGHNLWLEYNLWDLSIEKTFRCPRYEITLQRHLICDSICVH